ncbi:MAG: hypothetical protein HY007_00615 [Candidatus Sungbacteria bacterium]|nr:hypothetical protein [Candidatus Sungbacteria bacterium]
MAQKIFNFIASRSEHTRKVIAGIALCIGGVMLFFAWTAGVSARLPLLGSEFDLSIIQTSGNQDQPTIPASAAQGNEPSRIISPIQGLMESWRDLVRLFRGEYPAASSASLTNASSSPSQSQPIDELFNKMGDEPQPPPATPAPIPPVASPSDNLPPIEDLPGI